MNDFAIVSLNLTHRLFHLDDCLPPWKIGEIIINHVRRSSSLWEKYTQTWRQSERLRCCLPFELHCSFYYFILQVWFLPRFISLAVRRLCCRRIAAFPWWLWAKITFKQRAPRVKHKTCVSRGKPEKPLQCKGIGIAVLLNHPCRRCTEG